jgi:hypothetical protein
MQSNIQSNIHQWTHNEELKLIKSIKNKKSIEEIAKMHNRDSSSIELRLDKIIYENMERNNDVEYISSILNLTQDEIIKKYNSYKKYKLQINELNHLNNLNNFYNSNNLDQLNDLDQKMLKLERENKFIKLILENKFLHKRLNEQIKKKVINHNIIDIIKNMRCN